MTCSILSFIGEHTIFIGTVFAISVAGLIVGLGEYLEHKRGER